MISNLNKTEIRRVETLAELTTVMPLILEGFDQMNKKYKAFNLTVEQFTKEIIWILGTQPQNGLVVVWHNEQPVGFGAAKDNSEHYSDIKTLLLYALYVKKEHSKIYKKPLFDHAVELAKQQGYDELVAYNGRFSGACFRLFEKILGMHRQSTRFNLKLK